MSSRVRRTAAVALLAAGLLVVVPAPPAVAHEQLLASTPSEGERFEAAPSAVELRFSADVLTIGAVVRVVDEHGDDRVAGDPVLEGAVVTAPLEVLPAGGYEVRWRVVSGDGHPISGLVPFTVGDAEPLVRARADAGADTTVPSDATSGSDAVRSGLDGVVRTALIGGGGALVALILFAAVIPLRRRAHRGDL